MSKRETEISGGKTEASSESDRSGKSGKGAGTRSGGVSGGKATGGTERPTKSSPDGKGSGNR